MKKKIFVLCLLVVVSAVLFCGCNTMKDETAELLNSAKNASYGKTTTTVKTQLDGQTLTSVFVAEKTDDKTAVVNYIIEQLSLFDENSTVAPSETTTYSGSFYVSGGKISNHTGDNMLPDIEGAYTVLLTNGITFNKDYFGKTEVTTQDGKTQIVAEVKNPSAFLAQSFSGRNMTATMVVSQNALVSLALDYVDSNGAVVNITYEFTVEQSQQSVEA